MIMKRVSFLFSATFLVLATTTAVCDGFAVLPLNGGAVAHATTTTRTTTINMGADIELEPEPEGGEEMTALSTLPGSRMKNMGEASDVKNDDGTVYKFWLLAEADGSLIKGYRTQLLKDASKKANFPGFRKGQVPPYAQPQITAFSVQEGLIKTVESAVEAYGLKSIPGKDGEINVKEDVEAICKGYKVGDNIKFTTELQAIFDPEKEQPAAATLAPDDDDGIIDAEVEEATVTDSSE